MNSIDASVQKTDHSDGKENSSECVTDHEPQKPFVNLSLMMKGFRVNPLESPVTEDSGWKEDHSEFVSDHEGRKFRRDVG